MSDIGWKGKLVRHADGRTGHISGEYVGFCHIDLTIVTDEGDDGHVQLNINGPDSGETGWEWWCEDFTGGARYLPLGDHNVKGSTT